MSDLINRDDAIEALEKTHNNAEVWEVKCGVSEAIYTIKALPAAEAVQGEWILDEDADDVKCSVCGHLALLRVVVGDVGLQEYSNFCPNCGARMKGGDNNEID